MYRIEFRPAAVKQLQALQRRDQRRIVRRIEALADDPRPDGARKLAGSDSTYRIRVGAYRIIYDVLGRKLLILVVKVGHRRDVYRKR